MAENAPPLVTPTNEGQFEYQILTGHRKTDGTWKTDKQLRMEYLQLTDGLIHKMTDGVDVIDPYTGERQVKVPDVVVWLDKSARPLAWLTKDLWPKFAANPDTGEVPRRPDFKFVNIDRKQWVTSIDPEGVGTVDIDRIDQSIIRSLRSIFVSPAQKKHGLTPAIDAAKSSLDNKTIMIVDEVYASGRTLQYATAFFRRAFPTARVGATHWMRGITIRDGGIGNSDLPVWYKKYNEGGRGIGNRNDSLSGKSKISTQKLGRYFLSTRLRGDDPRSKQLRAELHHLAIFPDVPALPSIDRPDSDDRRDRMTHYNNGKSVDEVLEEKSIIKSER